MVLEFAGELFVWRGPAPYYFITVPDEPSAALESASPTVSYGEDALLSGPRFQQDISWDLPSRVSERKRHHDHVIERTDDRQELRDQINWRQHPHPGKGKASFALRGTRGSARSLLVVARHAGRTVARSLAAPGGNRLAANAMSAHERSSRAPPIRTTRTSVATCTLCLCSKVPADPAFGDDLDLPARAGL